MCTHIQLGNSASNYIEDYRTQKNIKKFLKQAEPLKPAQIKEFYEKLPKMRDLSDDIYHPYNQITLIYKTLFPTSNDISTTKAEKGSNKAIFLNYDEKPAFVFKGAKLYEDFVFHVPEGAKREHLSYLLDKSHFANVPPTFYIDLSDLNLTLGSMQIFRPSRELKNNENLDQTTLRKIFIHNLIMFNLDSGIHNLLLEDNQLFPIDFGYSLPIKAEKRSIGIFPQLDDRSFTFDEINYINQIDLDKMKNKLRTHGIEELAIQLQQNMLKLLKKAVNDKGITLKDLANVFYKVGGTTGCGYSSSAPTIIFTDDFLKVVNAKSDEEFDSAVTTLFQKIKEKRKS